MLLLHRVMAGRVMAGLDLAGLDLAGQDLAGLDPAIQALPSGACAAHVDLRAARVLGPACR
ncbi:hypothetical protein ACERNI_14435 [Camelimonas sp. ID_303_24]